MDGQLHLHAGLGDYRAFRPTLYSTKSATRVTSDPEKRPQQHKHKSHHHHHRDRDRDREDRHRHSSSKRQAAKEAVQSAIQPPTSFGDLLRQARGSKDSSPSHSRKGSVAPRQDRKRSSIDVGDGGISIPPKQPLRPEDVEKEGLRVQTRERDLRTALQSLSDQSLKTSRRLDDTYYSILEKVTVLRQTIGTLQELSGLTRELQVNFEADTKELVKDVSGQVDAFNGFQSSQRQVSALEERIKAGKQKADNLTARLTRAKERVDARAKSEAQWQATNTHRLRLFWGILGSIVAVIVALVFFHQLKPIHANEHPHTALDFASRSAVLDAPIPDIAKEAIMRPATRATSSITETSPQPTMEEDERLRIFDEL
ncbi:hypothetical protein T440DRAFT_470706 [Plenodomus tracheiphilus IPT5]|uniref:Uncharacterized protein n=1 Tax=Plenodomus tracheiphilus IPT5 TaxID=1408161 RepID=A0A6A7AZU2_9PLEO|nr:hypothetical protein T440DRAFT_470706 [Plenodomus tracheiphilus IPT5]